MHDLFAALADWVTSMVKTGGYIGVGGLILLENLFPPIPSELILPVAGFLVSTGELAFILVVLAATLGSLAGALILYGLGYWLGEDRVREFVQRHGHWLTLSESDVDQTRDWFDRHGGKAVLIGRFVPTVRSLISIPAGVGRMPLGRFALYTSVGSAGWNAVLVGVGWMLGDQWEQITPFMDVIEWGTLVVLAAGLAWFIWRRKSRRDAPAQTSGSGGRP